MNLRWSFRVASSRRRLAMRLATMPLCAAFWTLPCRVAPICIRVCAASFWWDSTASTSGEFRSASTAFTFAPSFSSATMARTFPARAAKWSGVMRLRGSCDVAGTPPRSTISWMSSASSSAAARHSLFTRRMGNGAGQRRGGGMSSGFVRVGFLFRAFRGGAGVRGGGTRGRVAHRVTSSRVSDMVVGERRADALRGDPRARRASGLSGPKPSSVPTDRANGWQARSRHVPEKATRVPKSSRAPSVDIARHC